MRIDLEFERELRYPSQACTCGSRHTCSRCRRIFEIRDFLEGVRLFTRQDVIQLRVLASARLPGTFDGVGLSGDTLRWTVRSLADRIEALLPQEGE